MQIDEGTIVSLEYEVRLADGELVEATDDRKPVQYLHGAGMLLPSLESRLAGLEEGSRHEFVIAAREAYGDRDETNVLTLPRGVFPSGVELSVGARLAARTQGGDTYPLTVREIFSDRVIVDLNHPLAGKDLHFEVTIRQVRSAGTDEVFSGKPRPMEIV